MASKRQSAAVLIPDVDGRVLMVRHAYRYRRFGLPGGVVDPGETPEQAAVREAKEEANVNVRLEYLIGRYLLMGGGKSDQHAFVYLAQIESGEPAIVDHDEIALLDWFDPAYPPSPLLTDAVAALRDWRNRNREVSRVEWRVPPEQPLPEGK